MCVFFLKKKTQVLSVHLLKQYRSNMTVMRTKGDRCVLANAFGFKLHTKIVLEGNGTFQEECAVRGGNPWQGHDRGFYPHQAVSNRESVLLAFMPLVSDITCT